MIQQFMLLICNYSLKECFLEKATTPALEIVINAGCKSKQVNYNITKLDKRKRITRYIDLAYLLRYREYPNWKSTNLFYYDTNKIHNQSTGNSSIDRASTYCTKRIIYTTSLKTIILVHPSCLRNEWVRLYLHLD